MLARGAALSVAASQASPPRLILSAQAAHSCGLHPQPDSGSYSPCYSPCLIGPSLFRVQGLQRHSVAGAAYEGRGEGQPESRRIYLSQGLCYSAYSSIVCWQTYCTCRFIKGKVTLDLLGLLRLSKLNLNLWCKGPWFVARCFYNCINRN